MKILHTILVLIAGTVIFCCTCCSSTSARGVLVNNFLDACREQNPAKAESMLTKYAKAEVVLQHGSMEAYLTAVNKNVGKEVRATSDSQEIQGPGDSGYFLLVPYKKNDKDEVFSFYIENVGDKQMAIDNILTTDLLVFDEVAPAIGILQIQAPKDAFWAYYNGALLGRHARIDYEGAPGDLSDAQRLAYLRQCSTELFRADILKNPKAVPDPDAGLSAEVAFLRFQGKMIIEHNIVPRVVSSAENSDLLLVEIPSRSAGGKVIEQRYEVVRLHGQYQLNRQVK